MAESENKPVINPDLLALLRCPVAVRNKELGEDPGRLTLEHDCWLVCAESNMKYPIRDGIPVMLIAEGKKWKNVAVEDLPVPPPSA
jgi:uncharacterized protein YbaR (Trm112 family)